MFSIFPSDVWDKRLVLIRQFLKYLYKFDIFKRQRKAEIKKKNDKTYIQNPYIARPVTVAS